MTRTWNGERLARVTLPVYLLAIYSTLGSIRTVSNALRDAGLLRLTVAIVFGVAALLAVAVLLRHPAARTLRTGAAIGLVALVYAAVTLPMSSPEEKLHFVQYGVVGLLAFFAAPAGWPAWARYLGAALFTLAAGWVDEGIQAVLPERYYDLRDVGFNAAAGAMALASFALFRFITARPAEAVNVAVHGSPPGSAG